MKFNNLYYSVDERVGVIKFNRPKSLNAFNRETLKELEQLLKEAAGDDKVRALVVTGSGERSFVAGADIDEMLTMTTIEAMRYTELGNGTCRYLENLAKPTVAAVNGIALGGGTEIAMSCDVRFASEKARFGQPEILLGIIPGWGGTQRLSRLVGQGRALELMMTGEQISAQKAYEIGLVNRLCSPEELLENAISFAKKLAGMPQFAVKMLKQSVYIGNDMDMTSALSFEIQCISQCFSTKDQKEGMAAFKEKRRPVWTGQ